MNLKCIMSLCLFVLIGQGIIQAQDNLATLINIVEAGKTYSLYKAKSSETNVIKEKETHFLKLVPPVYEIIFDTIELAPALNGNLDTSNYFIQTEVLVLKESGVEWKTARVSPLCRKEEGVPHLALCLLKTTPDYKIIHRKFFPFKNIFDTTSTDYIIPAETIIIQRKVLISKTAIHYITDKKTSLNPGEKIIEIPAGNWRKWEEITCPIGEFNNPSISDIQEALKKQQYKVSLTGKFDEETKHALLQFQQDNVLEEEGLTPETLQRLGVRRERLITIDF